MNLNEGYGLPLDVAICMNYLEAQGAKNIRRCPALSSCQIQARIQTLYGTSNLGFIVTEYIPFASHCLFLILKDHM
jgi:hypothetical protein